MNKSQIKALEALTHKYLKKWLGLPRGASWALVHDTHGLNIKSFEHLYNESRSLTLSNIRFFSDGRARHALDCKEERESQWTRKFSSACYAKGLIEEVVPPVAPQDLVLTEDQSLNVSLNEVSSEESLAPTPPSFSQEGLHRELSLRGRFRLGCRVGSMIFGRRRSGIM